MIFLGNHGFSLGLEIIEQPDLKDISPNLPPYLSVCILRIRIPLKGIAFLGQYLQAYVSFLSGEYPCTHFSF